MKERGREKKREHIEKHRARKKKLKKIRTIIRDENKGHNKEIRKIKVTKKGLSLMAKITIKREIRCFKCQTDAQRRKDRSSLIH